MNFNQLKSSGLLLLNLIIITLALNVEAGFWQGYGAKYNGPRSAKILPSVDFNMKFSCKGDSMTLQDILTNNTFNITHETLIPVLFSEGLTFQFNNYIRTAKVRADGSPYCE